MGCVIRRFLFQGYRAVFGLFPPGFPSNWTYNQASTLNLTESAALLDMSGRKSPGRNAEH
jgi:hypothetical protein